MMPKADKAAMTSPVMRPSVLRALSTASILCPSPVMSFTLTSTRSLESNPLSWLFLTVLFIASSFCITMSSFVLKVAKVAACSPGMLVFHREPNKVRRIPIMLDTEYNMLPIPILRVSERLIGVPLATDVDAIFWHSWQ